MAHNVKPLLTVTEFAAAASICRLTVLRLIRRGELAYVRIGKQYRIPRSALLPSKKIAAGTDAQ